ncbi:MAG: SDR family oxidoreductase [Bacteroidetes bacterium]|nr:SDR family oxidoreductase [Bacteroidota bacterium]
MEKILVTGANGLVGRALLRVLLQNGYTVVAVGRGPSRLKMEDPSLIYYAADITHPFEMQLILEKERPAVVVHAAAMTQADDCELRQNEAHVCNVEATARLLLDAESFSNFFLFLSTDFVFDGKKGMYTETDAEAPISWYGSTKLQAEAIIQTSDMPWAIARTCLVYGPATEQGRSNIFSWVLDSLQQNKPIKVVDDQWRTPTWVDDLVAGLLLIIQQRATGIWHLAGPDRSTPYQMALAIAQQYGLDASLITRVTADTFTQPAKRPLLTGFDISKAQQALGYRPGSIKENLSKMAG